MVQGRARIYPRRETFHFDSAFGRRGKPFALNRNGELKC